MLKLIAIFAYGATSLIFFSIPVIGLIYITYRFFTKYDVLNKMKVKLTSMKLIDE